MKKELNKKSMYQCLQDQNTLLKELQKNRRRMLEAWNMAEHTQMSVERSLGQIDVQLKEEMLQLSSLNETLADIIRCSMECEEKVSRYETNR